MKKAILMMTLSLSCLYGMSQEGSLLKIFPYARIGFLGIKPTRADANIYTITSEDVKYKGAVLGFGSEFAFDLKKVNPGIDIGYSSVFNNSYENIGERSGENKMNEFYFYSFADLFIANNLYIKVGFGGHYTMVKWSLTEFDDPEEKGVENKLFFGLTTAIGKDFPLNEKNFFSVSLKANPLFSPTDYYWGFMMPVTLNLGLKLKL